MPCRIRRRGSSSCGGSQEVLMHRAMAIIERELRRFRRSPLLIVMSLIFPLVQLIVLGYAFGGNVKNLTVAIVDQDGGLPAVKVRELAGAVAANAQNVRHCPLRQRRRGPRGAARRPGQRRADHPARLLAPRRRRAGAAARAHRGQHRQLRRGHAGRIDERDGGRPERETPERRPGRERGRRWTSSSCIRTCPTCSTCCPARSRCRSS